MGTTKSTTITNLDASPSVIPDARNSHGRVMAKIETLETAVADTTGQIYRFVRVNAQDRILSIKIFHDDVTTGTDMDCGIYAINGGDAVDVDCYADGYDASSANTTGTEIRFNDTTTASVSLAKQAVWEDASVSADPGNIQYDLCLTSNTDVSAAKTITLQVLYLAGS